MLTFGSVCSGIEAASVAWEPLGWHAVWFAEVDRAASEVLAYRFPDVPNHGDMTKLAAKVRAREIPAPDVLVGGTPCQAFSVAGMRRSLDDERGQLTLAFVVLADAIDEIRTADGLEPVIIVWENVPGVFTAKQNAFGCFLAGIAGEDDPLEPAGSKWTNAGAVLGPQRAIAWRTLDAQWFGLAQRRRRVFVVASAREGFDPAAILLEFDGVRRDSAPSREAGEGVTGTTAESIAGCGAFVPSSFGGYSSSSSSSTLRAHGGDYGGGTETIITGGRLRGAAGVDLQNASLCADDIGTLDSEGQSRGNRGHGVLQPVAYGGNNTAGPIDVATARNAHSGPHGRLDFESETFIVEPVGFSVEDYGGDASVEVSPTLRSMGQDGSHANGGGQVGVAYAINADTFDRTGEGSGGTAGERAGLGIDTELAYSLRAKRPDAVAYAIQERAVADTNCGPGGKGWREDNCAYTLEARHHVQPPAHDAVPPFDTTQITSPANRSNPRAGDPCHPLAAGAHPPAVCVTGSVTHTLKAEGFDASEDGTGRGQPITLGFYPTNRQPEAGIYEDVSPAVKVGSGGQSGNPPGVVVQMAVRRLMPVECERLQGFPDNWTLVPTGKNGKPAADGPRYKQCGNSMATTVMHWIGSRIDRAVARIGHNGGPPLDDFGVLLGGPPMDDFEGLLG